MDLAGGELEFNPCTTPVLVGMGLALRGNLSQLALPDLSAFPESSGRRNLTFSLDGTSDDNGVDYFRRNKVLQGAFVHAPNGAAIKQVDFSTVSSVYGTAAAEDYYFVEYKEPVASLVSRSRWKHFLFENFTSNLWQHDHVE